MMKGEFIEDVAVRETQEEFGVIPKNIKKIVGKFVFGKGDDILEHEVREVSEIDN